MTAPWKLCAGYAVVYFALSPLAMAEKRKFDILLPPTDQYIHYTDGLIRGPGKIDLRGLTFEAVSEPLESEVNEEEPFEEDEEDENSEGGQDKIDEGPPHSRSLQDQNVDGSTIDIAAFHLPHKCAKSHSGCDWTELGIGGRLDDGRLRWCCSNEAVEIGLCQEEKLGRLIINQTLYTGETRFIDVPAEGPMTKQIRYGELDAGVTGQYVVIFSNCDLGGRQVLVTGESVWLSIHGYLPGELYGFMFFYAAVLVVYFCLFLWYVISMRLNRESRIPIEKWILMTIILGLLEMFLRTSDYVIWNLDGHRVNLLAYVSIITGVLKKGISRCLIVMVSLGWGIVRDSLGSTMRTIVVLGLAYIAVAAAVELMIVFAVEDLTKLSYDEEVKIFDVVTILSIVLVIIDVVFVLWILDALNGTMEYLENMSQTRKLMRYLQLRCIFLFAILFAAVRLIFAAVDTYDEEGIVREEHEWVIDAAEELNYLFVLIGVAILWRPNPSAKEYAYVMELPAMGGDGDGENELELTGVVPSAMDDDDDDPASGSNGYRDGKDDTDNRFQIDDAEAA